jgi:ATP-binding cassette, subfamily C (CFTR/MRP), member 4
LHTRPLLTRTITVTTAAAIATEHHYYQQIILFAVAAVILVCVTLPYVTLLVLPMGILFWFARRRYLASSREIKRLEAVSRSPVYAEFGATLNGLTTLRYL